MRIFKKIINSLREERGIYFELEKEETGVPFVMSLRPLATFLRTFLNINTIHTGLLFAPYDRGGAPEGPPLYFKTAHDTVTKLTQDNVLIISND